MGVRSPPELVSGVRKVPPVGNPMNQDLFINKLERAMGVRSPPELVSGVRASPPCGESHESGFIH